MTDKEIQVIQSLVGEFSEDQLYNLQENLEFYVHPDVSMFVPVYRFCEYAVSPNHAHLAYSFIFYSGTFNTGGLIVEGKPKENPLKCKSIICAFSPGVEHQEVTQEGFSNYIAVFIGKKYFEEILKQFGVSPPVFKGDFFPSDDNLLYLIKWLMLEHNRAGQSSGQVISSIQKLITQCIARRVTGDDVPAFSAQVEGKTDQAIAFMHQHISEKISVARIAEHVNSSTSHFTKYFKEVTNKTPIEYLAKIRIEKAKRLLKISNMNFTEIAFDCGYSSSSYFSHCFIEAIRLTPSEYRNKFFISEK